MADKAAFQVIVLGPTGGPREDSVTGLLVRSTATQWSANSIAAVDAGTLLAGIIRILEKCDTESKDDKLVMKDGPFAGLSLPCKSPKANAAHIFQEIIGTVLVTHPHLDHLAGLAINTPIIEAGNGPKAVAALPSAISAIKNHLFNDVIWPNLSDEDGGAGLLTYQRLVEGGNPRFGRGEARGYVRACDGLLAKCLSVSHGRCKKRYDPETETHHRVGSTVFAADPLMLPSRAISADHSEAGFYSPARSPRLLPSNMKDAPVATVESSAFFIRDHHDNEVIVFGDIEPDSISLDPRNKRIWDVAAPKVTAGDLRAIFIECSYDDSAEDSSLYGHLCPRHLITELKVLAAKVMDIKHPNEASGKRKRAASTPGLDQGLSPRSKRHQSISIEKQRKSDAFLDPSSHRPRVGSSEYRGETPDLVHDAPTPSYNDSDYGNQVDSHDQQHTQEGNDSSQWADSEPPPLTGLSVYIIHIKEEMSDGPAPGDRILEQLRSHGEAARLGCEFHITKRGQSIWI